MEKGIRRHALAIATAGPLLFAGAGAPGLTAEPEPGKEPHQTNDLQTLKKDWAQALESLKGYSAAQREQALQKARTQLDAMDAQIEQLQMSLARQWNDLSVEAREQREATLRSLRGQRRDLAEWYGGMRHSSSSAWAEVKQGFVTAYEALGDSFGEAVEEFRSDPPSDSR